ncbi:MAG: FAD:protein FMN transferase [Patescibacteria group bacterium]
MASISFEALGTVWHIDSDVDQEFVDECELLARDFEQRYSRFLDDSLLSRLNSNKQLHDPPKEMVDMMQFAADAYTQTAGLFNITAGSALASRGYGKLNKGRLVAGWTNSLELSDGLIKIGDEVNLDFGGFGKGWLIDNLHDYLIGCGADYVLVNGGGDIRLTSSDVVMIPLMMPGDAGQKFADAHISSGALASSSPLIRSWGDNNHLVTSDGQSYSGDIDQLSVFAKTARDADMLATACIVSPDFLELAQEGGAEILVVSGSQYRATPSFPLVA